MNEKFYFLPTDKKKHFLQDDNINLGESSHTCPKYRKEQVYNIFAKFQAKHEG